MAAAPKKAGKAAAKEECVKVAVRCRPLNSKEREAAVTPCIRIDDRRGAIIISKPGDTKEEPKTFTFDFVYGGDSKQAKVFEDCAKPIVDSVLGTMFAYGQTGTGKTFTMEGDPDSEEMRGIMPNSFYYIMNAVQNAARNVEFLVRMSFLEIYKEEVFDLLNKEAYKRLDVRENPETGVFVEHLSTYVVKSVADMLKVLKKGQKSRKIGATNMNEGSSRSHSILTVIIETSETQVEEAKADGTPAPPPETKYRSGKLNLVDLAGSERQKKTGAEGDRLLEAKSINQSLSALGNVIKALVNPNATHTPFRDSKLTRLLQDSLGGNTKTVMIAALGPSPESWDESMSTLRYANRAKNIKNKPRINEDPKDTMLRECQEEILRLKAALEAKSKGLPFGVPGGPPVMGPAGALMPGPAIVQEVVKEVQVDTGIREEHIKSIEEKAKEEADRMSKKTDAEKAELLAQQKAAQEAAAKLAADLAAKAEAMEKEKAEMAAMQAKLAEREKQLMSGGVALDKAAAQKAELKRAEDELKARTEKEEQLKKELQAAEEAALYMDQSCKTSEEDIANTTTKMKQLSQKYNEKKQELEEMQEDFDAEREELVDTIRALDREIKLKHIVLDSFVPPHYIEMIEQRAIFDERNDSWVIPGVELACNNIRRELGPDGAPSSPTSSAPSGARAFRRPPTPNYARLTGGMMGGPAAGGAPPMGLGRGAAPAPEISPEVQAALRAALETPEQPRQPKDPFYTYGVGAGEPEPEVDGRSRRKRR